MIDQRINKLRELTYEEAGPYLRRPAKKLNWRVYAAP